MLAGLTNVTFEFGARVIVENATWHIQPEERIGLIGYNGTGKSTLLKVFVGEYLPSEGTVERSRSTSVGYLHQDLLSFESGESILQVALGAFEKVLQLEKEIEVIGHQLEHTVADSPEQQTLLNLYTDRLHEMDTLDGYNIHHKTEEVLQGLGFANADLNRPFKEFSGGWRMRVLLAKMILQQPDLLLLDEPTNHLDLPSIEWLEKYLQHYQGSVVIVSHDKYFLNRMVTKIVELYQRQLHIYNGNYSFYETEKELRMELAQRAFENQQDYIRQQERFIERFKAKASKAAQAQSAVKRLDRLEKLEETSLERPNMRINFRIDREPGRTLVTLTDVSKRFGENVIIDHAAAEINRGDKIALIGANGKGKSTLLRIIAGTEDFDGVRKWGHNVEPSFYAQHQMEALNLNNTVLDELKNAGSQQTEQELRTLLGCFLFSGDDVDKKIRVLSGGEKARVALAKTMVSKANFLLLDEPTNHLDMHSCDLLIDALNKYMGSLILVSHDRYFIQKTANKIWEIDDYKIREFIGTYDEWADWKERSLKAEAKPAKAKKEKQAEPATTAVAPAPSKPVNKELKKELQKQQRIFQELEARIAKLNNVKSEAEKALGNPQIYSDKDKFTASESEYKYASSELEKLNADYEKIFEKIMKLKAQTRS
ncbi:MAG TPA: ABC-F family ATP-binding cassette domain-containing protein [Flavitalea sp.]|nr:ABC-F family ATP-binding cassette domain-containing protein [Flavitalea sp.]